MLKEKVIEHVTSKSNYTMDRRRERSENYVVAQRKTYSDRLNKYVKGTKNE